MFEANHSSHEYTPIHKINFSAAHALAMLGVTNSRENFDLRLASGALQNSGPEHAAVIEGWIYLGDEASPALASPLLFADAFPPPIYNVIDRGEWGSVPTIDYAVHLKAPPPWAHPRTLPDEGGSRWPAGHRR
ncbi:MAG: hypothetical protein LBJ65_19105 [Burkholderia sp.]|jgi:hypothetical protein|uniref:hypothetical protein n=1 Tax=Burkholderia sp. TaxID=36773 RepID=UPI00283881FB|nr:hypothetical protein [Burkholderia sp.]MDR0243710.1 hypothetical protein [Burkholderia sp.]